MGLKLSVPPADEMMTLEEAKAYLRVDHADDDDLISELIVAAREHIEGPGRLNAVFMEQTWQLVLDRFPPAEIRLPLAPVQSASIAYYDEDGVQQTVDPALYYLDDVSRPPYVILADDESWPDTQDGANMVIVTFVAGFPPPSGDPAGNVPRVARLAAKQLVSHWYERRDLVTNDNVNQVPEFIWTLLHRYRMFL